MAESVESRVEAGAQALNEAKSTNNLDEKNETQEEKEEQNEVKKEVFSHVSHVFILFNTHSSYLESSPL